MGGMTLREAELGEAIQSPKVALSLLLRYEAEPERLTEMELEAIAAAFTREASQGRNIADAASVLAGLIVTVLVGLLAISVSVPKLADSTNMVALALGVLFFLIVLGMMYGLRFETRAESVLSSLDLLRVRRERHIIEMSRTRRGRRALVALWISAAPASQSTAAIGKPLR
ncbi:hypothetical protein [Leifsonia sp. 71-9]|uniref:hypothetical protein n=1 Tax=Leifsonia sp. 71-9 TaxID=1895934 RepID=UPI0009291A3B|nr:hypothetical protein [Leifsonia sp. 71-9]OJX72248.1 MAG: hypothetical protein BGO91_11290 [Leifsonia sp. 71-9]